MPSPPEPSTGGGGPGVSPYDTNVSSGARFGIEVVAWIAGPWAAAVLSGSGWSALPTLVVLFGLPALFNTPGDKASTVIATPGAARILIEMLLLVSAVAGAWIAWPSWAAILVTLLGLTMLATGLPRYRWLAAGAPPPP